MIRLLRNKLAIVCCIALSCSIFMTTMLSVLAITSSDYSVKLTTTDSAAVQEFTTNNVSNNLLSGIAPTITAESGTANPSHMLWNILTDGVYTTTSRLTITTSKSNTAARMTYALGKTTNIKNILVVCRENNPNMYGLDYEVFLSDNESDLYASDKRIFSTSSGSYSKVGGQLISYNDNCVIEGKFVGFRFFGRYNYGYHIAEIGVYGEQKIVLPTVNQTVTNSDYVENFVSENKARNLLIGIAPTMSVDSGTVSSNTQTWSILADGNYSDSKNRITISTSKNGTPVCLTYVLKRAAKISDCLIVCRENNHNLYGLEYELYVSDSLSDLYIPANKIFVKNSIDFSEGGQLLTFSEENIATGSYVGFRFTGGYNYGYHISELGVFGEELPPAPTVKQTVSNKAEVDAFIADNLGNNLLIGVTPSVVEEGTNIAVANVESGWNVLTDGSYTSRKSFFVTGKGTGKFRVTYSLPYRVSISEVLIVCRENNPGTYGLEYEIYVGDDVGSLYDNDNLVFTKSKDYSDGGQLIEMAEENKPEGYFIGFRLLNSPNKMHLGEIGVWGEKTKHTVPYNVLHTVPNLTDIQNQIQNDNLLKDIEPTLYDFGLPDKVWRKEINQTPECAWISVGGVWSNLTDGKLFVEPKRRIDIIQGTKVGGLALTYVLNEVTEIDNIVMVGMWTGFGDYCTQHYKIYVSDTLEDLYDGSNLVIDYDNGDRYDSKVKYSGAGQMFIFNEKPVGKYFGIRFTDENNTDEMVRLDEIGVYGTPVADSDTNLIKSKPFVIDSNQELSVEETTLLTDGNETDDVNIKTNGKSFDITYDLCKKMSFDRLTAVSAGSSLIQSLKVYAADTKEQLNMPSSLISEFNDVKNTKQKVDIQLDKAVKKRYLRFLFDGYSGEDLHLAEVSVIGSALQDLRKKNVLNDLDMDNISVWLMDAGVEMDFDEEKAALTDENETLKSIIDGNEKTSAKIYGAKSKQTIDILFKLQNLKIINNIQFSSAGKAPQKVEYYIGNTTAEVFALSAKPCATYLPSDENELQHQVDLLPTIGAYIRVSILPSDQNDADGSKMVTISDITINGYYIEGFLDESGDKNVLRTFKDKMTDITIQIQKLYSNDIWSDIQEMVVEKRTPNIYESSRLSGMLLKVYDAMYDIYFYDSNHKRITDLGGRSMLVALTIPKDQTEAYLAQSNEKDIWILNATYTEDAINYLLPADEITYSFAIAVYDNSPDNGDTTTNEGYDDSNSNYNYDDEYANDFLSDETDTIVNGNSVKEVWSTKIGSGKKNVPNGTITVNKTPLVLIYILIGLFSVEMIIAIIVVIKQIKKKKF